MIAAIAVVFALALLVVGGIALVNAVSGSPDKEPPSTAASPSGQTSSAPDASPTATTSAANVPLLIEVTGQPTKVVVRVPDTGTVVRSGVLNTGDTLQFDQTTLDVVATNGGALQVTIYGKVQPPKPQGQRATWYVRPKS
ncbi:hypothetical protein [Actinomadura opuntiae]|uniref:hypothetical protein n=1 Tax=Actinomadura sp. OS1-43 TaxID=604315 RepID=UPI00255A9539|nr:hypothetical protein [Actinomadura sp. OS1-43]